MKVKKCVSLSSNSSSSPGSGGASMYTQHGFNGELRGGGMNNPVIPLPHFDVIAFSSILETVSYNQN